MVTLSNSVDSILKSDRVPVYAGRSGFNLKKGLQSSDKTNDIPNEFIDEQGNTKHRGVTINSPQITQSFEDLNVDLDMEQLFAGSTATQGTLVPSTASGTKLTQWSSGDSSGLVIFSTGPTDEITGVCISYYSGGNVRIGEGASVSAVGSNYVTLSSSDDVINFSVGDQVIIQEDDSTTNASGGTIATISVISGSNVYYTGYNTSGLFAGGGDVYIYKYYDDPVTYTQFDSSGVPLTSVKGLEVFNFDNISGAAVSGVQVCRLPLTVAGTSTEIDSNDFRDNEFDLLMLYNDYNDDLIISEYVQGMGVTSITYNGNSDGNATTSYEFNTGKSARFKGYINRRPMAVNSDSTTFYLSSAGDTGNVFKGSEAVVNIPTNTTFNDQTFEKKFLKVSTIDNDGTYKEWDEKGSASGLSTTEYYVSGTTTVVFGDTLLEGNRIEFTYLCYASAVASADAYKFDADEFQRSGTPISVNGKYQPVTINTSDFDSRVDGIESTTISLTFNRDFYNTQGFSSQRIKPGDIGTLEGSFNTWQGYQKILRLLNDGTNDILAAGTFIDASDFANYTFNNDVPLRYRLYDPKDGTTEIKTMRVPKMQITADDESNSVGDDSTLSFRFVDKEGSLFFSR